MNSPAPCYGLHQLFDSIEIDDHHQARAICNTCPLILPCARHLADLKQAAGVYGAPEGTWAGQLHGAEGRRGRRKTTPRTVGAA